VPQQNSSGDGTTITAEAVDVAQHVGRQIRRARTRQGFTLQQLAQQCGVSFQQVQKYEDGITAPSVVRLWQLAVALDVSMNYFFDGLKSRAQVAQTPQGANGPRATRG
jgi:transcriptional regulator with XRE-family HTH domain